MRARAVGERVSASHRASTMDGKGEMSQVFENHKPRLIIGVTAIAVLIFVFASLVVYNHREVRRNFPGQRMRITK